MVTLGKITVRSPIAAPSPTATNGPIETSAPKLASAQRGQRVHARGRTPPAQRAETARANARYGSRARSIAQGAGGASSLRMTADARVVASNSRISDWRETSCRLAERPGCRRRAYVEFAVAFEPAVQSSGQFAQLHWLIQRVMLTGFFAVTRSKNVGRCRRCSDEAIGARANGARAVASRARHVIR